MTAGFSWHWKLLLLVLLLWFTEAGSRRYILLLWLLQLLFTGLQIELHEPPTKGPASLYRAVIHSSKTGEFACRIIVDDVYEIRKPGRIRAGPGRLLLELPADSPAIQPLPEPGDLIMAQARLSPLSPPRIPGEPDWRRYYLGQGVRGVLEADDYRILRGTGSWQVHWRQQIHRRLRRYLSKDTAALSTAMLLGVRDRLPRRIQNDFRGAGLSHLLALSGLHMGVLLWVLLLVLRLLPLPGKSRYAVAGIILILYGLLLPSTPSVQRSLLMAGVWLASRFLERDARLLNILCFTAVVNILVQPFVVWQIGFWLSYLAVAALVLWVDTGLNGHKKSLWSRLWQSLSVSVVLFLVLSPLILRFFGEVAPLGILLNLLAVPLASLFLMENYLLLAVSFIAPLAEPVAELLELIYVLLTTAAHWAASCTGCRIVWSLPVMWTLLSIDAALILYLFRGQWRNLLPVPVVVLIWFWCVPANPDWQFWMLDVGQGDALLLQRRKEALLVDGGHSWQGKRLVRSLRHLGVTRLQLVVATHADADHIGGLIPVLAGFPVDTLIIGGTRDNRLFGLLLNTAAEHAVPVRQVAAGDRIGNYSQLRLQVMHPREPGGCDNDHSVVLRVLTPGQSLLLTGDLEKSGERDLLAWGPLLQSHVLKVAHHGSAGASGTSFLQAVAPAISCISVGRRNRYGHPAPEAIHRLMVVQTQILRTDLSGTLALRLNPHGLQLIPWNRLWEIESVPDLLQIPGVNHSKNGTGSNE